MIRTVSGASLTAPDSSADRLCRTRDGRYRSFSDTLVVWIRLPLVPVIVST
jgi:hypothetical protein